MPCIFDANCAEIDRNGVKGGFSRPHHDRSDGACGRIRPQGLKDIGDNGSGGTS